MGGYGVLTLGLLAMSVALPLWEVAGAARTRSELPNLIRAAPDVIWNSFAFAAIAASLCVALGLVSWRAPIGLILWLPFLVPGVLLGRALTWAFNRPGWDWLYGGFGLVLLAFALRYLALGWNGTALALRAVDRDLIDAARLEGARGWALLRHAQWPQAGPQVAAAWYVTYLLCLWDVETLVLIYPPGGETLALRIFNLLHYGHHAQVNALCVLLLAVAVAPLGVWQIWSVVRSP
jgi:ABC-type Fe3+ transport system permease subunit